MFLTSFEKRDEEEKQEILRDQILLDVDGDNWWRLEIDGAPLKE